MSLRYFASFDLKDPMFSFGTLRLVRLPMGSTQIAVDLTQLTSSSYSGARTGLSVFNHWPLGLGRAKSLDAAAGSALARNYSGSSFAEILRSALRAEATAASWPNPSTLDVAYNLASDRYVFTYPTGFVEIDFTATDGRRLLGYSANQNVISGPVSQAPLAPTHVIVPEVSDITPLDGGVNYYEPEDIVLSVVTEYGRSSGVRRQCVPYYRDWVQEYETRQKTLRRAAVAAHPYTHQQLFESCRSVLPFVVSDSYDLNKDEVFYLRPEASAWDERACRRAGGNLDDAQFHVTYRTIVAGEFA